LASNKNDDKSILK